MLVKHMDNEFCTIEIHDDYRASDCEKQAILQRCGKILHGAGQRRGEKEKQEAGK